MGFARVGSNPTVVDVFLCIVVACTGPSGAMDSASDFGSGGWGFESPLGLPVPGNFFGVSCFCFFFFALLSRGCFCDCVMTFWLCTCGRFEDSKFGRVVKALALGASLERGMGSNPIACRFYFAAEWGCSSLGRAVGSQSAGTGIETLLLHLLLPVQCANGVSVTLKLPKL